jgi:GTPase SAR1 family protein
MDNKTTDLSIPILKTKPKEKLFPGGYLPEPNFRLAIIGASGSGKTYGLIAIMQKYMKGIFDRIYLFSPTADIKESNPWDELGLDQDRIHTEYNEQLIHNIIDEEREKKQLGVDSKTLIILDDLADVIHAKRNNMITKIIVKVRHYCSIVLISQKWNLLQPTIRLNCNHLFIYPCKDRDELKSLKQCCDCNDFEKMFKHATKKREGDKINSFLNINRDTNQFFRNLDTELFESRDDDNDKADDKSNEIELVAEI